MVVAKYESSDGAVYACGYHVIWCPKYRKPVLTGAVETRLKELIAERAELRGWDLAALEAMPDHVHVFLRVHPKDSPAFVANQLKGYTSRVLGTEFRYLRMMLPTLWSRSYFVTTVGSVSEEAVQRYIAEQKTRASKKAA